MDTTNVLTACAAIPQLSAVLHKFKDSDRRFASDLIACHSRTKSLSVRQAPWVGKLIERAEGSTATDPAKAQTIGDVTALKALFDRAAVHLTAPSVVFLVPELGVIRVYVTKSHTKYNGRTLVCDYGKHWTEQTDYGFITHDGQFEPKKYVTIPATLVEGLRAFAADPVGHAKEYGRLTGRCCFCRKRLEDERSTSQGYGATCAEKYNLPWGERPPADSVFLASDEAASHSTPSQDPLFEGLEVEAQT